MVTVLSTASGDRRGSFSTDYTTAHFTLRKNWEATVDLGAGKLVKVQEESEATLCTP